MKMHGKWVAWMAALALAAMLAATPREGAAGPRPYLMPQDPPGPILGEPDEPSITQQSRDQYRFSLGQLQAWLRGFTFRTRTATTSRQRTSPATSLRAGRHE